MSRLMSRTQRLRDIEQLLFRSPQGLRVTEIAATFAVNRRTIYRDLQLLSDAGVPLWQEGSRYGIIRDQYLATVRLKYNESVALYIAARLLARHADEHNPHIVSALTKLAATFPDPLAQYIARTAEAIQHRPINSRFVTNLEIIATCWAQLRKVRISYRSLRSGSVRPRDLAPYTIEPSAAGGLYVIGYDDWAQAVRTFKLERIEQAERLETTYTIPADFNPGSHFADAWGIMVGQTPVTVELRFSPTAATLIHERVWHPTQEVEALPDGSMSFRVAVSEPNEMRPWIRSWGPEVEVVAPESLRNDIAEDVHELARIYGL